MSFSRKINDLLKEKRRAEAELAKGVGIPYPTVDSMLKRDSDTKRLAAAARIAGYLGVSIEELISDERSSGIKEPKALSENEKKLIAMFRAMDSRGKSAVMSIAEHESGFSSGFEKTKRHGRNMIVYEAPAAAGSALPIITDDYFETYSENVPEGASFGIKIKGDSMEPLIADGSIVWVNRDTAVGNGEVGIFIVNGESLCKRLEYSGGKCFLVSENKAYEPIEIKETDDIRGVGKVIL